MPLQRESAHEGEDDEVLIDADGNGGNEEEQDSGAAATPGSTAGRRPRSCGASYAHPRSLPTELELSHSQNNRFRLSCITPGRLQQHARSMRRTVIARD